MGIPPEEFIHAEGSYVRVFSKTLYVNVRLLWKITVLSKTSPPLTFVHSALTGIKAMSYRGLVPQKAHIAPILNPKMPPIELLSYYYLFHHKKNRANSPT